MIEYLKKIALTLGFFAYSTSLLSQCEIKYRVYPGGMMQYYMEPVNFYWTSQKSLRGCIVTDKENYYLALMPLPFPPKPAGQKLKNDLKMTLSDGNSYSLKHFDTHYIEKDTVMQMLFLIKKDDLDNLLNLQVVDVTLDMMGSEGTRTYKFKLHKSALKEQLECFLKRKDEKQKK
jgi:hypothetical protein